MDSAFKSAPYPTLTTNELRQAVSRYVAAGNDDDAKCHAMRTEIMRREAVALGDTTVMTAGERLRWVRQQSRA